MSVAALPAPVTTRHEDGSETIVLYRTNEAGKTVKVTRRVRVETVPVKPREDRRNWARYGEAVGQSEDYQPQFGEEITLRLYPKREVPSKEQQQPEKKVGQRIKCNFCKGDHFSHLCPMRDKLAGLQETVPPPMPVGGPAAQGKYVSPAMRAGFIGGPPGMPMQSQQERDEASTLRVSNLPEDITENDLRSIFSIDGRVRIMRCNVVRNKITGRGRGFAFIAFETPTVAESVRQHFDGKAVNNLIMHVDFANAGRR